VSFGTATIRASSSNDVDYTTTGNQKGWFMDLIAPSNVAKGERVVTTAVLRGSRVIFATLVPSEEACDDGGTSWLMELGAGTGQAPQSPVLDLNNDDKVDDLDKGSSGGQTYIPSGLLPQGDLGIFKTPTILDCGSKLECKILSGSSGDLGVVKEGGGSGGGGMAGKRRSWRQLR
jgi:type IV pilus assembly protein PilY1